ncbi:arylalkylamine N-acetyltransferase-like 2 [Phlebotomus argentipes]|uniref:arylalkylamine N-acetyltransferase-like 2 n=1 Tax=Phlebotomus argentipes TaxID=94469 RepID=UPI002892BC97|nr:arylalkylamine N-acetyltransferase-like 2 [Phlebotomus argentipes]
MNPSRLLLLRVAKISDYESVLEFLRKHFYAYDVFGSDSNSQSAEDEENEMKAIDSGASVLAFTEGKLVGASLAVNFTEESCRENLQRLQKISEQRGFPNDLDGVIFIEEMKLRSEVCRRFGVKEACYMSLMCVHEDFRKLSLSNILLQKNLECVAELRYKVAFSLCISEIGHIFGKSTNFQPFYQVNLVDYQDFRGLNVFSHFPPDAKATVMFKLIGGNKL